MCNSESRIVVALIILLPIAFSQYLNSTIIETALSSVWTPVSSKFDRPATCSIVGHDYINDRIVIFGGINKNNSTGNDMNLYIYDMIQDKLFIIPDALYTYYNHWEYGGRKIAVIYNCGSTNAVIYDNSMYFVDNNGVSKLILNPFYKYIADSVNQSSVPAILDYMETVDIHGRKYYPRFPVANGCIFINHLLLYVFYTDQTYTQYSQKVLVFGSNWAVLDQFVQYDIFTPFRAGKAFFGADYSCGRIPCSCVAVDDTLYVIGGKKDRLTLVSLTEIPHFDLNNSYYYPFNASNLYRLSSNISSIGCSVIKDDKERYIYVLGGMNNSRQILKIDTVNINVLSVLNMTLSSDIKYSTIISSNENNRIYAFRGLDENSDQGVFIDISSTPAIIQVPNSDVRNQSILGLTMEFIFGIILIGFICICGAFLIYRWALKRYLQKSSQENLVEKVASEDVDKLEMINHRECVEGSNEKQEIELISHEKTNWSSEMLSEEKLQELYCTYLKSRFNCFHHCEQIGLTDQYIQQLFERFEQINIDSKT